MTDTHKRVLIPSMKSQLDLCRIQTESLSGQDHHLTYARRTAGRDVHCAKVARVGQRYQGFGDVINVDVIPFVRRRARILDLGFGNESPDHSWKSPVRIVAHSEGIKDPCPRHRDI